MDTRALKAVADWLKTTDLTQVVYRRGGDGLMLGLDASTNVPAACFPDTALIPVVSPEVGLFHWSAPGSPRRAEKGSDVASGQVLGLVDTGMRKVEITAPASGRLISELVDDGRAVEYGQPLFFLAPK